MERMHRDALNQDRLQQASQTSGNDTLALCRLCSHDSAALRHTAHTWGTACLVAQMYWDQIDAQRRGDQADCRPLPVTVNARQITRIKERRLFKATLEVARTLQANENHGEVSTHRI